MHIPADPIDWEYPFGIPPMSREELIAKKPWLEHGEPFVPWSWRGAYSELGFFRLVNGCELSTAEREVISYISYCCVNGFPLGDVALSQGGSVSTFKYRNRILAADPWPEEVSFLGDAEVPIMDRSLAEFVRDNLVSNLCLDLHEFDVLGNGEVPASRPTRIHAIANVKHGVHSFSAIAKLKGFSNSHFEDSIESASGEVASYLLYEKIQRYDIWAGGSVGVLVSPRGYRKLLEFRPGLIADRWSEPYFCPMGIAFPDNSGFEKSLAPEWPPLTLQVPTQEFLRERVPAFALHNPSGWAASMINPAHRRHHHFVAYCKAHNLPTKGV